MIMLKRVKLNLRTVIKKLVLGQCLFMHCWDS